LISTLMKSYLNMLKIVSIKIPFHGYFL